jgi:predicted nuclease of restriction endonuclease-like (RecB) superfamily
MSQQRAVIAANSEMIALYWQIGRDILERQNKQGWGAKVVDRLASDLCREFPDMKGFSPRNLKYMRLFAETWTDEQFVQQVIAQIPWGHNLEILTKIKSCEEREWYARADIEYGWSRSVLVHQIESKLYHRQGQAITNFDKQLPAPQSELAQQTNHLN